MKNFLFLFCLLLGFSHQANSAAVMTTMASHEDDAFIIALRDESGKRETPYLVMLKDKKESHKIAIEVPKSIRGREITSIGSNKNSLFILSQWTVEVGDFPQLHQYSFASKTWKKLGVFKCGVFDKLVVENKKSSLGCSDGSIRIISHEGTGLKNSMVLDPYQSSATHSGAKAKLSGLPYYWRKLTVNKNSGVKKSRTNRILIMSGDDLYQK